MNRLTAKPARRLTLRKFLLTAVTGLLLACLASFLAIYLTLPYGTAGDMVQLGREELSQRLFPGEPQPVSFPSPLVEAARPFTGQVDLDRMLADLSWLAADARLGRKAGSPSEEEVSGWLMERLQSLGLRTFTEAGLESYFQPFPTAERGKTGKNVIAVLPGTGVTARYLLVGAHYDHVGVDAGGQVYNGADDDASGVAAVLEIARILSEAEPRPRETIVFVLFSGEEGGRRGSSAFGRRLRSKGLAQDSQLLNLEALGAVQGSELYLDVWDQDTRANETLAAAVLTAGEALQIPVTRLGRDPGSDAGRLLAYGVPAVTVDVAWADGDNHPYMHTSQDDVSALDPQGMEMAARAALVSAWLLANDRR